MEKQFNDDSYLRLDLQRMRACWFYHQLCFHKQKNAFHPTQRTHFFASFSGNRWISLPKIGCFGYLLRTHWNSSEKKNGKKSIKKLEFPNGNSNVSKFLWENYRNWNFSLSSLCDSTPESVELMLSTERSTEGDASCDDSDDDRRARSASEPLKSCSISLQRSSSSSFPFAAPSF